MPFNPYRVPADVAAEAFGGAPLSPHPGAAVLGAVWALAVLRVLVAVMAREHGGQEVGLAVLLLVLIPVVLNRRTPP